MWEKNEFDERSNYFRSNEFKIKIFFLCDLIDSLLCWRSGSWKFGGLRMQFRVKSRRFRQKSSLVGTSRTGQNGVFLWGIHWKNNDFRHVLFVSWLPDKAENGFRSGFEAVWEGGFECGKGVQNGKFIGVRPGWAANSLKGKSRKYSLLLRILWKNMYFMTNSL